MGKLKLIIILISLGATLFIINNVRLASKEKSLSSISEVTTEKRDKDILRNCPVSTEWGFPVGYPSAQGYYNAQIFGKNNHLGDDWNGVGGGNTDIGDNVYSISDGIVSFSDNLGGGWGNIVRIYHNIGSFEKPQFIESFYAHLEDVSVSEGTVVKAGQKIGTIGNVQGKYLAHLHFEIRHKVDLPIGPGYSYNNSGYLDPTQFIRKMMKKMNN